MYLAHYTKRFIPEFDAECRLHADLVFLINERKTTLRFFLYFSCGYGLE